MSFTFPTSNTYRPYNPIWQGGVIGQFNAPGSYVIDEACPPIDVEDINLKSGQILKAKAGELRRARGDALKWGSGATTPKGLGVSLDTAVTYTVERYAEAVPEDLDSAVTEGDLVPGGKVKLNLFASFEALKLKREREFMALCAAANTGSEVTLSGGDVWDQAGSDPFGNIADAVDYVSKSGHEADTVLIGRSVVPVLMKNAAVRAYMNQAADRHLMGIRQFEEALRNIFPSIDRVVVSKARYNSANVEGTASMSDVLADSVIVYKRMEGGERVSNESGDMMVTPGWIARVRAYDLFLDNWEDHDARVRWHRAQFAEGLAVADTAYAYGIYNCVT